MPLPTPGGDSEKGFMARCMSNEHMRSKFPDQAQRAAVCYRQFRKNETRGFLRSVQKANLGDETLS